MEYSQDIKFAGFWIRTLAMIIDGLVFIPIYFGLRYAFGADKIGFFYAYEGACLIYFAGLDASSCQGSVGKAVLKLKVVDLSLKRISLTRSLIRYFYLLLPHVPMLWFSQLFYSPRIQALSANFKQTQVMKPEYASFMGYFLIANVISLLLGIVWCLTMALTKQKTAVHDLLSKTRVIKANRSNASTI